MFNRKAYMKVYNKQYRQEIRQYYQNNKEILDKKHKQWRKNNLDKIRQYRQNHKLKINAWNKKYKNEKRKTDLKFNLSCRMRVEIYNTLKRNKMSKHWEDIVGYTLKDLIKRLRKTMPEGYTWQDYLEGRLHIDHKIPSSAFNFTKAEHIDFKKCWALSNLRLLPAKENKVKGSKLTKPFQPALQI